MIENKNVLYYGDNLTVLKKLVEENPKGFIDLIYIDPPFNSKRNYNMLFEDLVSENENKATAQKEAFKDTWSNVNLSDELEDMKSFTDNVNIYRFLNENRAIYSNSQMSYLTMMSHRLYYMYKLLKPTGSLYLHCDSTMGHYLKVLLDIIFGEKNFRDEIIWKRATSQQKGSQYDSKRWGTNVDSIFYYVKTKDAKLRPLLDINTLKQEVIYEKFNKVDENGRRYYDDTAHLFCNPSMGARPNLCYEWRGFKNPHPSGWRLSKETLEEEFNKGNIVILPNGKLQRRKYIEDYKGVPVGNLWLDILPVSGDEDIGYDTQKPEALLERIIKASTTEGDLVADFFCGCGTTVTVAEKLKRQWLGVDINHLAISLIEDKRLKPLKAKYIIKGFPNDIASAERLAQDDKHQFEEWVVEYLLKGHKTKKTGDGGIDGHAVFTLNKKKLQAVIEVKGGNVTIAQIRAFKDSISTFNADFGIFVGFKKHITDGMRKEADMLGKVELAESLFSLNKMYILIIEDIMEGKIPQILSDNITY